MADSVMPAERASARRATLAVTLWLAASTLLGGLDLPVLGYATFRFVPFGVVAGLLGILYVFVLTHTGVLERPPGKLGVVAVVYWVAATSMAFRMLLPPPGLVQAMLAVSAAAWAAVLLAAPDSDRAVVRLGVLGVGLAVLRFGLAPVLQARSGLPDWGPFRLAAAADGIRDVLIAYAPERPAAQAVHFAALVCWIAALWVSGRVPYTDSEGELW